MKINQTIKIYDQTGDAYSKAHPRPSFHIADFAKLIKKSDKILELGCGPGIDADYLTRKGAEVWASDLSRTMLKLAQKRNPKVHFEQKDMREVEFPENSFDAVVASFSIIHLPKKDIPKLLKNIHNFLKLKGLFYIGIQEGESFEGNVRSKYNVKDLLFLNVMTEKEIKDLLENAGFEIQKEFRRQATHKEWPYKKHVFVTRSK